MMVPVFEPCGHCFGYGVQDFEPDGTPCDEPCEAWLTQNPDDWVVVQKLIDATARVREAHEARKGDDHAG